jgi:hypothetical protein
MKLRVPSKWLCGLTAAAISIARLTAQDGVKPRPSFPPGEPLMGQPQPISTNLPVSNNTVAGAKPFQTLPVTHEKVAVEQKPPGAYVSSWLLDIVKLAEAGINRDVMLTFIESAGTFNLDAEQIIYLHDLRVPAEVITAMLQHDFEIVSGQRAPGGAVSGSQPGFNLKFAHSESPRTATTSPGTATSSSESAGTTPVLRSTQAQLSRFFWREFEPQRRAPVTPAVVSPVRLPYAVQLTDPIIMIPGEGRSPNLVVIELFP